MPDPNEFVEYDEAIAKIKGCDKSSINPPTKPTSQPNIKVKTEESKTKVKLQHFFL